MDRDEKDIRLDELNNLAKFVLTFMQESFERSTICQFIVQRAKQLTDQPEEEISD